MTHHFFIELDDGTIYRKALYLMVKTMVSGSDFPINQSSDHEITITCGGLGRSHDRPAGGSHLIGGDRMMFFWAVG